MSQRVVITGLGAITPIGNDPKTMWDQAVQEACGIDKITAFDTTDYKVKVAAEVKGFEPMDYIDRKDARRMDRFTQMAVAASKQAIKDGEINLESIDKERFGVIVGSGIGGLGTIEQEHQKLIEKGPKRVSPLFIPLIISNMAAGSIAIQLGAKGICTNIVTACSTGTHCIGEAFRSIQRGDADLILAGGTESSITPLAVAGFSSLTALSTNEDPKRASIPFDVNRDGFVIGEGAGILLLESLEHAQKRGAKILAEIVGYGATCDAYHITAPAPEGEGASRAMKLAIQDAGIKIDDVSYINAHGTSTPANDKTETEAIKNVFGEKAYSVPITSFKSMVGHLLGAAGAVEAALSVKILENQYIPPTIGYKDKDPECDLDYVTNEGRNAEINYVLSNSLGFGGHNGTILIKKAEIQ